MAEYQDLESSFKLSWCKHMDSRNKYPERNETTFQAFLLEMPQPGLEMFDNIKVVNENGRKFGDFCWPEHLTNYRLSRDKNLLKWIFENADGLVYVVCLGVDRIVAVINVSMIPTMIELLRWITASQGLLQFRLARFSSFRSSCEARFSEGFLSSFFEAGLAVLTAMRDAMRPARWPLGAREPDVLDRAAGYRGGA